ncbi:MAG TPA: glucose-6-phosphate isomerase [Pseudonocardia sp.]|nr:glucose-6-phosphate isomerase [Pseudonocardia sp.]
MADHELLAEASRFATGLAEDKVASGIAAKDVTLWGPDAESMAAVRLNWVDLAATSRPLLARIAQLRAELASLGVHRVLLAGTGGSALAAAAICRADGVPLTLLDTADAGQLDDALAGDLAATVLVVASKSGTAVLPDSIHRIFTEQFTAAGLAPAEHIVVVTDPGSPLHHRAEDADLVVIEADPQVGEAYSALSAFALVPAGLAGADLDALLDDAAAAEALYGHDDVDNPALVLGAALAAGHSAGATHVVLADTGSSLDGSDLAGFGDWVEQLLAETTGLLPVFVEGPSAPGFGGPDATTVALGADPSGAQLSTAGPLGELFTLWQYAVAVAGRLLGVNPFDEPEVATTEAATRVLLDESPGGGPAQPDDGTSFTDGAIEVFAGDWLPAGTEHTAAAAVRALLAAAPEHGHLSIEAYLDRVEDASTAVLRAELARRSGLPTTFGWGRRRPRPTGPDQRVEPPGGVYLRVTGSVAADVAVPGRPYTLAALQYAQARGDAEVLAERGRPVLRLHLTDREVGFVQLAAALLG